LPTETPKIEEKSAASAVAATPWQESWIDLAGGCLRFLQAGSGRPLILVHGLMGYSFSWRFSIPALSPHATVYAIDNLGAGLSVTPTGMDCSMRAAAGRVLQFVDAMGFEDYDLLGTSHGGAVAMLAAAISADRHDPRLKRLILVAPVNPWSRHGRRLAPFIGSTVGSFLFRHTVERWRFLDYLWLRRMFGDGSKIPPDSLEGYRLPVRRNRGFEYGRKIVSTWTSDLADLDQSLAKIRDYPTLLVWGTRDRAVSFRSAERLRQNFHNCRMVVFENIGHLPYEEAPQEFNRAVIDYLVGRS